MPRLLPIGFIALSLLGALSLGFFFVEPAERAPGTEPTPTSTAATTPSDRSLAAFESLTRLPEHESASDLVRNKITDTSLAPFATAPARGDTHSPTAGSLTTRIYITDAESTPVFGNSERPSSATSFLTARPAPRRLSAPAVLATPPADLGLSPAQTEALAVLADEFTAYVDPQSDPKSESLHARPLHQIDLNRVQDATTATDFMIKQRYGHQAFVRMQQAAMHQLNHQAAAP